MSETRYEVKEGDTFDSIAERFKIDAWEDLWEHNRDALKGRIDSPDLLKPTDKEGRPIVLNVPDDRDHELGRSLLEKKRVRPDAYLGGTSWLDPRGLVSNTLVGDDGKPLEDGTEVTIRDPVLGKTYVEKVEGGRIARRLPRKEWEVKVKAFPGFEERYGWFRKAAGKGDIAAKAMEALAASGPAAAPDAALQAGGRTAREVVPGDWALGEQAPPAAGSGAGAGGGKGAMAAAEDPEDPSLIL